MSDPVKVSVGVRAISSQAPSPQKAKKLEKKIVREMSDPIRTAEYAEGMGIRKLTLNKETDTIQFELEEEFYHTLRLISKWKGIQPEVYLGQLLTEYFLTAGKDGKINSRTIKEIL